MVVFPELLLDLGRQTCFWVHLDLIFLVSNKKCTGANRGSRLSLFKVGFSRVVTLISLLAEIVPEVEFLP